MRTSVRQWCLPLFSGYPIGSRPSSDQPALLRRPVLTMRGPAIGRWWVRNGRKLVICHLLNKYLLSS